MHFENCVILILRLFIDYSITHLIKVYSIQHAVCLLRCDYEDAFEFLFFIIIAGGCFEWHTRCINNNTHGIIHAILSYIHVMTQACMLLFHLIWLIDFTPLRLKLFINLSLWLFPHSIPFAAHMCNKIFTPKVQST